MYDDSLEQRRPRIDRQNKVALEVGEMSDEHIGYSMDDVEYDPIERTHGIPQEQTNSTPTNAN